MRKLTKMSLQELAAKMPAIDENTQENCVGGNYYFDIQTGSYLGKDWFGSMANGSGVYLLSLADFTTNVLLSGCNGMSSGVFWGSGEYITNGFAYPEEVLHNVLEYYADICGYNDDFNVNIVNSMDPIRFIGTSNDNSRDEINIPARTIFQEELINLFPND